MTEEQKACPVCGKRYRWYETACPTCQVALVPFKDEPPVSVFQTEDPGALALATLALEGEGIEYVVKRVGTAQALGWREQFGASPDLEVPAEIVVPTSDADKARNLLADLQSPAAATAEPVSSRPAVVSGLPDQGPIELRDTDNGAVVGHITEAQLQFLRDQLEEESTTDRDYYVDAPTIEMLETAHGDSTLIALLRRALGQREGIELRWSDRRVT
jgi:hypothetical protein